MSAKALQNMDNLIGNQILKINNSKLNVVSGDQSEMDEDEESFFKKRLVLTTFCDFNHFCYSRSLGGKDMNALVSNKKGEKKYMEKIEKKYKINPNKTAQEDSASERFSNLTENGKKSFGYKKPRKNYQGIYKSNIPSLKSEVTNQVNDAYQPSKQNPSKSAFINFRVSDIKIYTKEPIWREKQPI
jgi:hypothetical protein